MTNSDPAWTEATPDESGVYHVFVAFSFVGMEVGLLLGNLPVAVGGLLMFGWCLVGVLVEAGVVAARHRSVAVVGISLVYLALGVGIHGLSGDLVVAPRDLALWAASAGLLVRAMPAVLSRDHAAV